MPTTKVYLDDDNNIAQEDEATQAVVTETDDQGRLVEERWLRIVRPGSAEADHMEIQEKASQILASEPPGKFPIWLIVLISVAVVVTLVFLI